MMRRTLAGLALAALAACGDSFTPPALRLEPVAYDSVVVAGLSAALAVRVLDSAGTPRAGAEVRWSVVAGGGQVTAASTSDPDGVAAATYADTVAGAKIVRAAAGAAATVSLGVTVTPAAAARLERQSGDGQNPLAGQPVPAPLTVAARDQYGNGVGGIPVSWAITAGSGTLSAPSSTTGASGSASITLTTAQAPETYTVTASAAGLAGSPVSFTVATFGVTAQVSVPANYGLHDQYVRDGLAFLSAWNTGLLIYDVGNGIRGGSPQNPVFVDSIITSANGVPGGAQVHNAWWYHAPGGQQRYVFIGQEGPGVIGVSSLGDIHVVDISNIDEPVEVASYRMAGAGTHNFWVDEVAEILYAAYYNGGVVALDVSGDLLGDLASREIARIQPGGPGGFVWGVHLHTNGSLYATDMLRGFWQLKLVDGAFQVLGGGNNVPPAHRSSDQWVHGNVAYSGTYSSFNAPGNVVYVWRLGPTGAPILADSIVTSGISTVSDVEVSADGRLLMFSAEGGINAGLHFYSLVANPERPVRLASFQVQTGVHTATFATIGGRLYAFAAKDPSSPALLILDVTALAQ